MSSLFGQTRLSENHPRRWEMLPDVAVEDSEAKRDSQAEQWATKFNVSVERMRLLIQAFGADEDAIAEVHRLTVTTKGCGNDGTVQSVER